MGFSEIETKEPIILRYTRFPDYFKKSRQHARTCGDGSHRKCKPEKRYFDGHALGSQHVVGMNWVMHYSKILYIDQGKAFRFNFTPLKVFEDYEHYYELGAQQKRIYCSL